MTQQVSLHRASRILEALTKALTANEPKASKKLSIFQPSIGVFLAELQNETNRRVDVSTRLLEIRHKIRSQIGDLNASVGISRLLSEKRYLEEKIALLKKLPGVVPTVQIVEDDDYFRRSRKKSAPVPDVLNPATVLATVGALLTRHAGNATSVSEEIEVSSVNQYASQKFRNDVLDAERRLDIISESLHALNATHKIEISDEDVDWLKDNNVL